MFGARGSIGRFDQWMYPFYRHDIDTGVLTHQEAQELLENLWIKLNYFAGNNDSLRNVALGGQTPDGKDACNELTYMCLEATAKLRLPEPKLNLRLFPGSPPKLLRAGCRVICLGLSQPSIFNDEVAIPALLNIGIPIEVACDYCNDGCSELVTGGVGTSAFGVFGAIPLLNETVRKAAAEGYKTFDEVIEDFKQRLTGFMPNGPRGVRQVTYPFFAASIDDCLEKASPDGVRYTIWSRIPSQLAHVADGLAAIRKYIYEEQSLTWDELIAALDDNYENHESLRQRLLNRTSKYGNDIDEVDLIIKEIAEYFCDETHRRAQNTFGPSAKQTAGFMNFGIHGQRDVPACPDGRKCGENIPNSFSPALGRDRSGPTAVLKSAAKDDMTKAGHGSVLDITFSLNALKSPEAFEKFVAFVKTFLALPCTATLQVNTLDRDTLLKAQKNPDDPQYRTLLVRVWGFSTVFVTLDPALQNHVLERLEHVF
jgi:formate C-acetyltransferase